MQYSFAQLEAIWLQASQGTSYNTQSWAQLMAAIALAESSGDPNSINATDNNGTQTSWGLWQISNGSHSQVSPNWNDPVTNAQLAIGKLNSQGLGAWGTYDSGAYLQYYKANTGTTPASSFPGNTNSPATNAQLLSQNPTSNLLNTIFPQLSFGGLSAQVASTFGAGSIRDLFIRLGFILLGGTLLIVGLVVMSGKQVSQILPIAVAPEAGAAKGAANASARKQAERKVSSD